MNELITRAKFFAIGAHNAVGQKRKFSGKDYWHHCQDVFDIAKHYLMSYENSFFTEIEILEAAWLHDTVEDTKVTLQQIDIVFSHDIKEIVNGMTKKDTVEKTHKFLSIQLNDIKFLKLCDTLANLRDVYAEKNKKFAEKFIAKKKDMLNVAYFNGQELFGELYDVVTITIELIEKEMVDW